MSMDIQKVFDTQVEVLGHLQVWSKGEDVYFRIGSTECVMPFGNARDLANHIKNVILKDEV